MLGAQPDAGVWKVRGSQGSRCSPACVRHRQWERHERVGIECKSQVLERENKGVPTPGVCPQGPGRKYEPVSPAAATLSPRHLPAAHRCPAPLAQLHEEGGNWAVLSEHVSKFLRKILIYKR